MGIIPGLSVGIIPGLSVGIMTENYEWELSPSISMTQKSWDLLGILAYSKICCPIVDF